MDIDIKNAKVEFEKYTSNYNKINPKINLKIRHIQRVATNARKIAEKLNLSKEDVALAELIGLLHDIGRFEQIKLYNTFLDARSVNHAEYGVKILFEDGLIRKFIKENTYDDIIKKAISNHNRRYMDIDRNLKPKELLHTKIIRDADKLDIFHVLIEEDMNVLWGDNYKNEIITDKVYKEFFVEKIVNYKDVSTGLDLAVANFAYVYDLNFDISLKIINKANYLEKIYNRFKLNDPTTQERLKKISQTANKYIKQRIGKVYN